MKMDQTILNVTGISVRQGSTGSTGQPVRDMVITTTDGDLVLHLAGESREDLQVTFAGVSRGAGKRP